MAEEWAELDGTAGLDLDNLTLPEVELPDVEVAPKGIPPENAWTKPKQYSESRRQSGDIRVHKETSYAGNFGRGGVSHDNVHGSSASSFTSNRRNGRASGNSEPSDSSLFVTNLPFDVTEDVIARFFDDFNVAQNDVYLVRHSNSKDIKGAVVQLKSAQEAQNAIDVLDHKQLHNRAVRVRIDNFERRNNGGFPSAHAANAPPGYGDAVAGRDRKSYTSSGFSNSSFGGDPSSRDGFSGGNSAGGRERRGYGGAGGQYEPAGSSSHGNGFGGIGKERDEAGRGSRDRRRSGLQADDPTIPQGPTPEGRKRLQLKPRTKPLPTLEIDTRAIDSPASQRVNPPHNNASGISSRSGDPARISSPVARDGSPNHSAGFEHQFSTKVPSNKPGIADVRGTKKGSEDTVHRVTNTFAALNMEEQLDD